MIAVYRDPKMATTVKWLVVLSLVAAACNGDSGARFSSGSLAQAVAADLMKDSASPGRSQEVACLADAIVDDIGEDRLEVLAVIETNNRNLGDIAFTDDEINSIIDAKARCAGLDPTTAGSVDEPDDPAGQQPGRSKGGCSYPSGDPTGATQIGDQRLTAGQTLENFVLNSGGNHAILPANVANVNVKNGSVYANGADNIKLGNNSSYQDLFLVMATSGPHLDAMQGQGATGVEIDNVTIVMQDRSNVTSAILFQTLLGGGGDRHQDITFDLNCIKIVGSGPYGEDIRVDYKAGASVTGRISNVSMDGNIVITDRGGGGNCLIEVDATALPHVVNNGCTIVRAQSDP